MMSAGLFLMILPLTFDSKWMILPLALIILGASEVVSESKIGPACFILGMASIAISCLAIAYTALTASW